MALDWGLSYVRPAYSLTLSIWLVLLDWKAIHAKTPQEHVNDAWRTSTLDPLGLTQKVTTRYYRPLFRPPVYRCVRVKLFSGNISRMMDDTCLFSDFYLDDVGNLDLKLVRSRWGLGSIQIIAYTRETGLKLFIPRDLDLLPAKHVDVLKGHDGCLRIIEVLSESELELRSRNAQLRKVADRMRTVFDYILALLIFLLLSWICFVCFSACLKQNVAQGILKNAAGLLRFAPSLKLIDLRTLL